MKRFIAGAITFSVIGVGICLLWQFRILPSFEEVRESRDIFHAYAMTMPVRAVVFFSLLYVGAVALSVPIATPLSLLAGFLFGSLVGTIVVVVSATAGATCTFILTRYFFRDYFLAKLGSVGDNIRQETHLNGFRDVLIARLIPAVPFSLINVLAGLTHAPLRSYVFATAIGIVPFSFVYVHAGEALGEIQSLSDLGSSESVVFLSRIALVIVVLYFIKRLYGSKRRNPSV